MIGNTWSEDHRQVHDTDHSAHPTVGQAAGNIPSFSNPGAYRLPSFEGNGGVVQGPAQDAQSIIPSAGSPVQTGA